MHDELRSEQCSRFLRAVADPLRLKIIQCLRAGPRSVGEVSEVLGVELANVSHHLILLRNAGLVRSARQGKFIVYSLHPDFFRPKGPDDAADCLDFGCCRLELTGD